MFAIASMRSFVAVVLGEVAEERDSAFEGVNVDEAAKLRLFAAATASASFKSIKSGDVVPSLSSSCLRLRALAFFEWFRVEGDVLILDGGWNALSSRRTGSLSSDMDILTRLRDEELRESANGGVGDGDRRRRRLRHKADEDDRGAAAPPSVGMRRATVSVASPLPPPRGRRGRSSPGVPVSSLLGSK